MFLKKFGNVRGLLNKVSDNGRTLLSKAGSVYQKGKVVADDAQHILGKVAQTADKYSGALGGVASIVAPELAPAVIGGVKLLDKVSHGANKASGMIDRAKEVDKQFNNALEKSRAVQSTAEPPHSFV